MSRRLKIGLLVFFFALCGAALLAIWQVRRHANPPQARELFSAVHQQLTEFRAADFVSAYRHSAVGVQEKFSLTQFEEMVRRDYASMTQAGSVEFGEVHVVGNAALVQVYLTTPDGAVRAFLYSFTAEADGWKIDGVQPLGPLPQRHAPGLHV